MKILAAVLIGTILFSGGPGGTEFFGSRTKGEFNLVEAQFKHIQQQIEAGEDAREALNTLKETIEIVKTIQLQERLKILFANHNDLYNDALEVRRKAAASVVEALAEIKKQIQNEGSLIYTSSMVIDKK